MPAVGDPHPFPRLRWLALAWLAVYVPSYALTYGLKNFLFLCNIGVILTAVGLWRGSALLLSSQALSALGVCAAWWLDAGARLLTGRSLLGVTAYMWDPRYPLFTRLLSFYHVVWPILLLACLRRVGYDRRGYPLQAGIAAVALVTSRLANPATNVNFAWREPFLGRSLGPAPVHLLLTWLALAGIVYGLTHSLLRALLPAGAGLTGAGAPQPAAS
jgi:hypothetical protein